MAERTTCPACGAPVDYDHSGQTVRCDFCGADVRIEESEDTLRAQVVLKPPQEDITEAGQAALRETIEERSALNDALYNPPLERPSDPFSIPPTQAGGAEVYTIPEQQPVQEPVLHGTVLHSDGTPVVPTSSGSSATRWIIITVAVVVGVCLMCACLGVLVLMNYSVIGR